MTEEELIEAAEAETFADTIRNLARGTLDAEATMAMHDVVEAVAHLGKKGTVTIELTVERTGGTGRTVTVAGTVKAKAPTPDPEVTVRFVGTGGSLHTDDPYAKRLPGIPFRDTDGVVKAVDPLSDEVRTIAPVEDTPAPRAITEEDTTE